MQSQNCGGASLSSLKAITMASLPGLHLRGTTFQLRTIIPLALRHHFGGRAKISQSLRTSDSREAKVSGTAMRAALLANFEQLRRRGRDTTLRAPSPRRPQQLTALRL